MVGHVHNLFKQTHDVSDLIKNASDRDCLFSEGRIRKELVSPEPFLDTGKAAASAETSTAAAAKVCHFFNGKPGSCKKGEECNFAHNIEKETTEKYESVKTMPTSFAFSPMVSKAFDPRYKTILCKFNESAKGCFKGDACSFAHGLTELRSGISSDESYESASESDESYLDYNYDDDYGYY
jgi:hypothetical protein